jgi:probable selenium-dependent hydroxylase accessory protein YqeC
VLIQGDFGACYHVVERAFRLGLVPLYSTTRRIAVEQHLEAGSPLFVAVGTVPEKVTGPSPAGVDHLFFETTAGHVIVEADGARSMSIKAPAEHEPAIPATSTLVIVVAAIDSVGRPIREVAHRPERVAALSGIAEDDVVTVPGLASVILHPEGGLKGIPKAARVAVVITRTTPETARSAAKLGDLLVAHPRVDRVVALPPTVG